MKHGAYDYLMKPHDVDALASKVLAAFFEGRDGEKKGPPG